MSDSTSKQFFIHLGLPKTATTYLQHHCFPLFEDVHVAHLGREGDRRLALFFEELAYANPAFYPIDEKKRELDALTREIEHDKILISVEELFGWFHLNFANNLFVADALRRLLPEARILVVLRRQADWLESAYKQTLRQYSGESINGFLRLRKDAFETRRLYPGRPQINVREVDYFTYIRNYVELFGRQNVKVLPYEMLAGDADGFLKEFCGFLEAPAVPAPAITTTNRGYSRLSGWLARTLNRFMINEYHGHGVIPERPFHDWFLVRRDRGLFFRVLAGLSGRMNLNYLLEHILDRLIHADAKFISDEKRRAIFHMHAQSNRKLDQEYDLGLGDFGYY